MLGFVNYNGTIINCDRPVIKAQDQGYRYGYGLFETMKVVSEQIVMADLHFERLFRSCSLLQFQVPELITRESLENQVLQLCKKNDCEKLARVRLSASAGNGGLYDGDEKFQYLVECWPLQNSVNEFNENGLIIDVFPGARKSCDHFSNVKSANFLPYVMAAKYAREKKRNDCLVMNIHERICDATTANLFWIKNEVILTPPLTEGCIAGVMRKFLAEKLQAAGYKMREVVCEMTDLENAEEIFLTNAIHGIRWVKQFSEKTFSSSVSEILFRKFIAPLFAGDSPL